MKRNVIYSMLLTMVAFVLTSCGDKDTEGLSRVTYYPTMEIKGDNPQIVAKGSVYQDPGYESIMAGEDVSDQVTVSGTVDTSKSGYYTLTYTSPKNSDGFGASTTRTIAVVDMTSPYEGLYACQASSYRVREGAKVAYGKDFPVLVLDNGDGTLSVDDLLGGWYCQRAGYGSDYAMEATLSVAEDGTLTLKESYVPGWGDSHDDFTGTFDAATSTFNMTTVYAGMDFVQTWVKIVNE